MKNWAAHLLTVQNLDMRLAALETKYRTIPLEKERLKEEYRAAGEKVLASGAEVRKWETFLKEKEAETAALDEKIKKIQIQSATVKKNSEYQALMNEIASTHAKKSEIESAQISAFDSLEAAKKALAEAETELVRKLLVGHTDAHTSVVGNQVFGQIACSVVDDGQRLCGQLYQVPGHRGDILHIEIEFGRRVDEHQHGFTVHALLYFIHPLYGFGVGGIASYSPNGVGGIEYHTAFV